MNLRMIDRLAESLRTASRLFSSHWTSKTIGGFLWLALGTVPSRFATLIATTLVVRILGKVSYGEFSLVRSTANAFVAVALFGMGKTAAKYVSELLILDKERVGRIIALNYLFTFLFGLVVATAICIAAPYICAQTIHAPWLVDQVRIGSLLTVLLAMVGAQSGVLAGFQAFRQTSLAAAISGFASIPFFVAGAKFWGVTGAIVGFSTSALFNVLLNSLFIFRLLKAHDVRYSFCSCWKERSVLFNFCLPSTLYSLFSSLVTWGVAVALARQTDGTAELGVFDATRQIQTAVLYLPVLAANVVLPALSELNALNDKERYLKTIKYNVVINVAFTSICALGVAIFSPYVMQCFGKDFESGVSVLLVQLGSCVVLGVLNVGGSVLTSIGALWTRFWIAVAWGTLTFVGVAMAAYLSPGAFGVAVATLLAYAVQVALTFIYVKKRLVDFDSFR